jgi:hypothetical protein
MALLCTQIETLHLGAGTVMMNCVRLEVFTAVRMMITMFFWVLRP